MDNAKENTTQQYKQNINMLSPENIEQLANSLGKSLRSFMRDKEEKLEDMKNDCRENIVKHPFSSVVSAFTLGVVMGLLLRRN